MKSETDTGLPMWSPDAERARHKPHTVETHADTWMVFASNFSRDQQFEIVRLCRVVSFTAGGAVNTAKLNGYFQAAYAWRER